MRARIERCFGLDPLISRDAAVTGLFRAGVPGEPSAAARGVADAHAAPAYRSRSTNPNWPVAGAMGGAGFQAASRYR